MSSKRKLDDIYVMKSEKKSNDELSNLTCGVKEVKKNIEKSDDKLFDFSVVVCEKAYKEQKNIIWSNLGFKLALILIRFGTDETKKSEINDEYEKIFGLELTDELMNSYLKIINQLRSADTHIANCLMINNDHNIKLKEDYIKKVSNLAEIFCKSFASIQNDIDEYVIKYSKGLITTPGIILMESSFMIMSILSFQLKYSFNNDTNVKNFYQFGKTIKMSYMWKRSIIPFYENDKYKIIVLEFDTTSDSKTDVVFVLSTETDETKKYIAPYLSENNLDLLLTHAKFKEVYIELPTLSCESFHEISTILTEKNFKYLFSPNFHPNISNIKQLCVDNITQKCKFEIIKETKKTLPIIKPAFERPICFPNRKIDKFLASQPFFYRLRIDKIPIMDGVFYGLK